MSSSDSMQAYLIGTGALAVVVAPACQALVSRWLPLNTTPAPALDPDQVRITVSPQSFDRPETPAAGAELQLGPVSATRTPEGFVLRSEGGHGTVDLAGGAATLAVDATSENPDPCHAMLTIASALLLAGRASAVVHAGAVVDPRGRAWLVAGDSHAGKSTVCASLASAGWDFLSDDQVVLSDGDPVVAEGWLRPMHLDEGWPGTAPTGRRVAVDPRSLEGGRWRETATLGGIIMPSVSPDAPTRLEPATAGDGLTELVRQSPWLLAVRETAEAVLTLLTHASQGPCHRVSLGLDTYGAPERLAEVLRPAVD